MVRNLQYRVRSRSIHRNRHGWLRITQIGLGVLTIALSVFVLAFPCATYISIIWILSVPLFIVEIHISFFIALACNSSRCICIDKVITICIYVWLEVNQVLTRLLTVERLRVFSDSVLLVAITILAYNLTPPSLINGKLSGIETQSFLDNVYGLISSFFVISFFGSFIPKFLIT